MSYNDTLSDGLTRIKNAQMAKHDFALLRYSKLMLDVLSVMAKEGYIVDHEVITQENGIKLVKANLKYYEEFPVITDISRISKPGRRKYISVRDLPKAKNGLAVIILSTSKGVMSDFEARSRHLGGEMLCVIN